MESLKWVVLASFVFPILWAIASAMAATGIRKKFADLGVLTGKTKGEFYVLVGPPNSISSLGVGKEILQWQASGYHIALTFTNDVCDGIAHEYSA